MSHNFITITGTRLPSSSPLPSITTAVTATIASPTTSLGLAEGLEYPDIMPTPSLSASGMQGFITVVGTRLPSPSSTKPIPSTLPTQLVGRSDANVGAGWTTSDIHVQIAAFVAMVVLLGGFMVLAIVLGVRNVRRVKKEEARVEQEADRVEEVGKGVKVEVEVVATEV